MRSGYRSSADVRLPLAALLGGGSATALLALVVSSAGGSGWTAAGAGLAASILGGAATWLAGRSAGARLAEGPAGADRFDAQAVELANLRLEARIDELTLLHDVTRSLTSTLELDELFRRLAELIGGTRSFESFAILQMDEERGGLAVRTAFGFPSDEDPTGARLPITDETCRRAVQSRGHVLTRPEAGASGLEGLGWAPPAGMLLTMAMRHKDRVEGLLAFSRAESSPFTEGELELLRNIAGQAALAIANARLFEQTVKLSLTDPLTGLNNRRHFFSKLDLEVMRALRFGTPVTVAMIDIDHFKNLNDTLGHAAGDVVLQEMAAVLGANVRRVDTVARFGGEEFCVILPNVGKDEAGIAAAKIRRLIEESRFPGGETQAGGRITVSLGHATFPDDASDLDSLLEAADMALYASKREGRNRATAFTAALRER
ncbi:MAG TPA: GGDEF domain-containing protein, partial [Vulgatibacter sp.]